MAQEHSERPCSLKADPELLDVWQLAKQDIETFPAEGLEQLLQRSKHWHVPKCLPHNC